MNLLNTCLGRALIVSAIGCTPFLCPRNAILGAPPKTSDHPQPAINILACPKRISFPDDLNSSEIVEDRDGNWIVRFPIANYSIYHFKGWHDFLKRYGHSRERVDMKWKQPLLAVVGGEFRAMEDGFEACRRKVQEASQTIADTQLREIAKQAYFSTEPPIPKPPGNGRIPEIRFPTQ